VRRRKVSVMEFLSFGSRGIHTRGLAHAVPQISHQQSAIANL
jgi:hypothetical protein